MKQAILEWDGSPRAVIPSEFMREQTVPILAARQHAEDSPNEYGVAIFVIVESTVAADADADNNAHKHGLEAAKDVNIVENDAVSKNATKGISKDGEIDVTKDGAKDAAKQIPEESEKNATKGEATDGAKQAAASQVEDGAKKVAQGGEEDGGKESGAKHDGTDGARDKTQGDAKDVTEQSAQNGTEGVSKDGSKDRSNDGSNDAVKGTSEITSNGASKATTEISAKDISKVSAAGGVNDSGKDAATSVENESAVKETASKTAATENDVKSTDGDAVTSVEKESAVKEKASQTATAENGAKSGDGDAVKGKDNPKSGAENGRANTSRRRVVYRQLPMYYVSPRVAKLRGRGLQAGWYVVPEVGKKFCIHATNISSVSSSSASPGEERKSAIEIRVDGTNIFTGLSLISSGINDVFKGFAHSSKYTQGSVDGTETIREFKFASVNPTEETDGGASAPSKNNPLKTTGCVELQIAYGKLEGPTDAPLPTVEESGNNNDDGDDEVEVVANVDEKEAIKAGCSVKTGREKTKMDVAVRRIPGKFVVDSQAPPAVITIYFRERYWLQSRSIIDGDGNIWKPSMDETPVDLTDENCEPPKKKAKTDVVDLTLVDDKIDLTAD